MNIILIFGGNSLEHDISVITAKQIYEIAKIKHNVKLVYLDKNDKFNLCESQNFNIKNFPNNVKISPVIIKDKCLYKATMFGLKKIFDVECALMCTHGGNGENGAVVDYLNLCGIPTTAGSGAALSVAMDKWLTKLCLKGLGISTVKGVLVSKFQDRNDIIEIVQNQLGYPVILKPCTGGSSIGIEIAKNEDELKNAINIAFEFDQKVLIEQALIDYEEYNCAAIGNSKDLIISEIDRPVKKDEILSFKDKYMQKNKKGGMKLLKRNFDIDEKLKRKIQTYTTKIYQELGFSGVVRIDFIFDKTKSKLYVNEINSIPGSLAIYLFNKKSINSLEFIDLLIKKSIEEYNVLQKNYKNFSTNLLNMQ